MAAQEVELEEKNEQADKLIEIVQLETSKVSKEKEIGKAQKGGGFLKCSSVKY